MKNAVGLGRAASAQSPLDTLQSKRHLILAGERLFGSKGIDGTSLREIAVEAAHGNNNAVRYHFGSKDGLIEAIFHSRVSQLEPLRYQLLDIAEKRGILFDIKTLLEIIVLPHFTLRDESGNFPYAAFLLQYLVHYWPRGMIHSVADLSVPSPSLHKAHKLILGQLSYLPAEIAESRLLNLTFAFLSALVCQTSRIPLVEARKSQSMIDDLIDQMAVAMTMPWRKHGSLFDEMLEVAADLSASAGPA